jgi:phospholipid transport system substrate-binding protein
MRQARDTERVVTLVALAGVLLAAPSVQAGPGGPLETLETKNTEVNRLLQKKFDKDTREEQKQKEDIKVLAGSLLDYGELARRAMAQHWETLSPAQRLEFSTTFKQMLENNYVKQVRSNVDYRVEYKPEQVQGDEATVETVLKLKTRGKSTDAEIVYKLHKVEASGALRWMVWDIITDESSLLRNYKSQFHRIISEQGYPKLLEKMKAKLKETT